MHRNLDFEDQPVKIITKLILSLIKTGQMKRLIIFLALVLFAAAGCREKKSTYYTRVGDFTPYMNFQEKLNGKVETVTEKSYWAIPEGETYAKGAKVTKHELDSVGWTYDFKAMYDEGGELVSCITTDENDGIITRWDFKKVEEMITRGEYSIGDTLKSYVLITEGGDGLSTQFENFNAATDTLIQKAERSGKYQSDTLRIKYYNSRGGLRFTDLMAFNDQGLMPYAVRIGADGMIMGGIMIKFNENGFISETSFLDGEKNITGTNQMSYEYDNQGNWIKVICKDPGTGTTMISERTYKYYE